MSGTSTISDDDLAREPRWDPARLAALPGRTRADLLGAWGPNVTKRFGAGALARVRARLPACFADVPDVGSARAWVPAGAQLAVTEAIVDACLGGDPRALRAPILEDTRAGLGKVQLLAVRALGPARAIRLGIRDFTKLYDRGEAAASDGDDRRVRCAFRGAPLFAHPTWRLLQLYATFTLLELAGQRGIVVGEDLGDGGFATIATW